MKSKFSADLLLDLVFPKNCQGCFREGLYLCTPCQAKLESPLARCMVCGKGSLLGRTHGDCQSAEIALSGIMVAAPYQSQAIRNLIWHLKYSSVQEIAEILSILMVDYFLSNNLVDYFTASLVVPVPLYERRRRSRGFNQAELLAQNFALKLGLEYRPLLRRLVNAKRQVDLERAERWNNVRDQFAAAALPSLGERKIILIDDVATTGATLNECAKVLQKQKPSEIWGLVVARN